MTATLRSAVIGAALVLAAGPAAASPGPASVVGTWTAMSNQTAASLAITAQIGPAPCHRILGTMTNTPSGTADVIDGFYCPASGRISFGRRDATTGRWALTYVGNLSWASSTLYIGGTVLQQRKGLPDPLGEYAFWAQK